MQLRGRPVEDRPVRLLTASDCERCRDGFVAQPVNALSSAAYLAAAAVVARGLGRHRSDRAPSPSGTAAALAALGIGSIAYHGPGGTAGRRLHDASIVIMAWSLAWNDLRHLAGQPPAPPSHLAAISALALATTSPTMSGTVQVVAAGTALAAGSAVMLAGHSSSGIRARTWAAATMALGALAHRAGRTGGWACRPEARLQLHAAWHVLSAAALALAAVAQVQDQQGPRRPRR